MNATSTHETISSSIERPILLSGANYLAHRFRLHQQSDASSHLSDSTSQSIMNERLGKLLQTFQGIEDKFKLMTGLEETISNLLSYMDLQNIEIDPELSDLISDISNGQKGNTWV